VFVLCPDGPQTRASDPFSGSEFGVHLGPILLKKAWSSVSVFSKYPQCVVLLHSDGSLTNLTGLNNWHSISGRGRDFSLRFYSVHTSSEVPLASCSLSTSGSFPGIKQVQLTTYLCLLPKLITCGSLRTIPQTSSWCSA
jgi:hypothetical protein